MNEKQMKELYFEGLFSQQVKRYKHETDGKFIDVLTLPTNKSLEMFFNRLYSRYKIKHSYQDYMNECIYHTYNAVMRFEVRDGGSWQGMIDGTDKANIGKLISSIKTAVEHEIWYFVNDGGKRTKNEDRENVKVKFNMTSLDSLIMGAEGEETTLVNSISSEMGFWGDKEGYKADHFKKWFEENRHRFLLRNQNLLIDNLAKCSHEKDGYTENDVEAVTGVKSNNMTATMNRIKKRTLDAFEKENPMGHKTQLEMQKEEEIELWLPLIDLIYSDDASQNDKISAWLIANLDNEKVSNMVYDHITGKESIAVTDAYANGGQIPSKVLYKVIEKVEARLDYLHQLDTTSVKFYKKPEEMGRWTPEAHKEWNKKAKAWKEQPTKVYKLNPDGTVGEFLREEKYVPFKHKDEAIHEVLPTGAVSITNIVE